MIAHQIAAAWEWMQGLAPLEAAALIGAVLVIPAVFALQAILGAWK